MPPPSALRLGCVAGAAVAALLVSATAFPADAPSPGKLEQVWSVAGHWTGVASDNQTGSIYALGARGHGAEIDASGRTRRSFDLQGVDGNVVRLAREKDRAAPLLVTYRVWSDRVRASDVAGHLLWSYPEGRAAVDDVCTADLDGDGSDEVVVSFNGNGGLDAVDRKGRPVWRRSLVSDAWSITAGAASNADGPRLFAGGGKVYALNGKGDIATTVDPGCYVSGPLRVSLPIAAPREETIVVACSPAGRKETIRGIGLDGTARWSRALPEDAQPRVTSAEVATDRPWVAVGTEGGSVYVLEVGTGAVVAAGTDLGDAPQVAWFAPSGAGPPLLLVAAGRELGAYRVEP